MQAGLQWKQSTRYSKVRQLTLHFHGAQAGLKYYTNTYEHSLFICTHNLKHRTFAMRIRPQVVKDDNKGYVLTTETGGMMTSLNGAISILGYWIFVNKLSSVKVEYLKKKY